jgi:hypothetical protein
MEKPTAAHTTPIKQAQAMQKIIALPSSQAIHQMPNKMTSLDKVFPVDFRGF